MDEYAHYADSDAPRGEFTPDGPSRQLPTTRQVITHALWGGVLGMATLPLLAWLFATPNGDPRMPWWPVVFLVYFLLMRWVQRLFRAPRPRLEKHADQVDWQRAKRALLITAETGVLSRDRGAHTAAGVLACDDIESAVWDFAPVVGALIAWFILPSWIWLAFCGLIAVIAVSDLPSARRGLRYLRVVHSEYRIGRPSSEGQQ